MTTQPEPIRVLVADDDEDQRLLLEQILLKRGEVRHRVSTVPDGRSALRALREEVFDVALLDLSMPGLDGLDVMGAISGDPARPQVVFVSGYGTVATATQAMKLGAFDFMEKPVDGERLRAVVWKAARARALFSRSERLEEVARRDAGDVRIVTQDPGMEEVLELVARVAPSEVSVLVTGESGTGKELIARELHRLSGREEEPLVALNCASVSEALAESELFGHEKGSFTGAVARKIGLVELADGGTLFLDEIGELDPALQAKFLRSLESKTFRRVGGLKELPANFRLVSATHQPLLDRVEAGTFRQDLYYRINAIVVELPPLRDRPADIPLLARHFLEMTRPGEADRWRVEDDAMAVLEGYPWPGNIRELRNVVERAALLCPGRTIRVRDLGSDLVRRGSTGGRDAGSSGDGGLPSLDLDELEAMAVEQALARTGWHQGEAAELLGVSARTLHRKIKSYGLRRPE